MNTILGRTSPGGSLGIKVTRTPQSIEKHARPVGLRWTIKNRMRAEYMKGWLGVFLARGLSKNFHIATIQPRLSALLIRANGDVIDYGIIGIGRVVTTAFAEYQVDEMVAETSAWGDFKFHDSGVGVTGAAIGDTDIETTDGESRATGSQLEGATGEIYKSVGTITYSTTKAITEHGLLNIAAGGILLDRHVFAAVNVINGDSIQFTYEYTIDDGG
jgi:hypothetical protein